MTDQPPHPAANAISHGLVALQTLVAQPSVHTRSQSPATRVRTAQLDHESHRRLAALDAQIRAVDGDFTRTLGEAFLRSVLLGRLLSEAGEVLPRRDFSAWASERINGGDRAVRYHIQAFRRLGPFVLQNGTLRSDLPPIPYDAARLLSQSSVSDDTRARVFSGRLPPTREAILAASGRIPRTNRQPDPAGVLLAVIVRLDRVPSSRDLARAIASYDDAASLAELVLAVAEALTDAAERVLDQPT